MNDTLVASARGMLHAQACRAGDDGRWLERMPVAKALNVLFIGAVSLVVVVVVCCRGNCCRLVVVVLGVVVAILYPTGDTETHCVQSVGAML